MGWQFTVFVLPILFATVLGVGLAGYSTAVFRRRSRDPIVAIFSLVAAVSVVWTGASALKLLQTDPALKVAFYRLLHVGVAFLPPLLVLFVAAYTDRDRWLRADAVAGLFTLPVLFVLLVLVDPAGVVVAGTEVVTDGLTILHVVDGPGFLLFSVYSVVLVLMALGLTFLETKRVGRAYYPQTALLALGVLAPLVIGAVSAAGVPPFTDDRVNFVPVSAAISILACGTLLFRYRLFELPPLAVRTAMKHTPDGLFVLDAADRIVHANDHGQRLLEQSDAAIGEAVSELLAGFDPGSDSEDAFTFRDGAGEASYYRAFTRPLTRGARRIGWVVVLRDETVQQRQQRELQRKNEQLEQFASMVSHDLRNPLTVARGHLDIAREEVDHDSLEAVEAAHERMNGILDQLLILTSAGRGVTDPDPVELAPAAESAWRNVETAAADLSVETEGSIVADLQLLQHVFENLFRNAVEHGGDDVRVVVGDLDGGFFVADDGPGIPADDRDAVLESGYSTTTDGTGLGLDIVETVVDAHGWTLTVTEGAAGGARFEITDVDRPRS